jgi:hypothetical protein
MVMPLIADKDDLLMRMAATRKANTSPGAGGQRQRPYANDHGS